MKRYLLILAIVLAVYVTSGQGEIPRPDGILAPEEPLQTEFPRAARLEKNGDRITRLAIFEITARVISASRYRFDRAAKLAPVDLVLGWGPMSDTQILKQISFTQNMRAYTWWVRTFPVPREVIETHSANMHMIPNDAAIENQLVSIRPGNLVHLTGSLVEVTSKEGWHWKSSLSRNDTGAGACELILVESLRVW